MRDFVHAQVRRLSPLALACGLVAGAAAEEGVGSGFRVCADPANLPYSNRAGEGFENRIARVLAADLGQEPEFFWFAEHRNFLRRTLSAGLCDLVITVPAGLSTVAATRPYFTSSYVAVTRADDKRLFTSFDDAWLKDARIGLQLVGNEGVTTPPAVAISKRGVNEHITPFTMWSEDSNANPQGDIVDAVADGRIDIAFVWGPFAGYFGKRHAGRLAIKTITEDPQSPELVFAFPMSIGVRKDDSALLATLQGALDRNQEKIAAILSDAGVPIVDPRPPSETGQQPPPQTQ